MIRPKSKLPFVLEHMDIIDDEINFVLPEGTEIFSKDAEFIVHACNNYEKLVIFIKEEQKIIENLILNTETSPLRNHLCDKNIKILQLLKELNEL